MARILVVDDELAVRRVLQEILEESGHTVVTAQNGDSAAKQLLRSTQPIDLVVTDLSMPGIPGIDLAEWIHTSFAELPVIVISGHLEDEGGAMRETLIGFGVTEILGKPFTPDKVMSAVERSLSVKH